MYLWVPYICIYIYTVNPFNKFVDGPWSFGSPWSGFINCSILGIDLELPENPKKPHPLVKYLENFSSRGSSQGVLTSNFLRGKRRGDFDGTRCCAIAWFHVRENRGGTATTLARCYVRGGSGSGSGSGGGKNRKNRKKRKNTSSST